MKSLLLPTALLLSSIASAQLNGTYTVGGSSPNYATLTAAVADLMSNGATGNVTFDIRPGTYTGQYALGAIPGTPGNVTFRNTTNGAQPVNLQWDATGTSDNFIFQVDGTDGVRFEKLTFRPLDEVYARAIEFFNGIAILQIEQCVFHGSSNPDGSGYFDRSLVRCDQNAASTTENPQDVMIMDNSFFNGNTAIDLDFRGFNGSRSQGLIITGNEFIDQVGTGIYVNNAVGQIGDNFIKTDVGNWFVGIRTSYFDGGSQVRRNRIEARATNGCEGIEVSNTQSTTGNMISNNMVYVEGTGEVWGMAVFNLWDMKILHNSVFVAGGTPENSYAFYHLSSFTDGQDALVRNNIFANNSGGAAYTINVPSNIATEDHNDLFTTGSVLSRIAGTDHADLAAHQSGTGMGDGDVDIDPVFPSQPDLHMNNCAMDNLGEYFFVLGGDIDGDARGNPVCDMGADEYNASTNAVQAPTITILSSDLPYVLGLNAAFISYNWNTGSTTATTTITTGGNYTCNVTDVNGCNYQVNTTVIVDINTSMNEALGQARAILAPNPARDIVVVNGVDGVREIRVYNSQGLFVQRYWNALPFSVATFSPGLYSVEVHNAFGRAAVLRLIVD